MNETESTFSMARPALICALAVFVVSGCATTASYRPEIESMKTALAEAKAAGAETLVPEEYARAEVCLDWLTHEATEFRPFADPKTDKYVVTCRPAFQALKDKLAAASAVKAPPPVAALPVPEPPPAPAPSEAAAPPAEPAPVPYEGRYPTMGALPVPEPPPAPAPSEAAAPPTQPRPVPEPAPAPERVAPPPVVKEKEPKVEKVKVSLQDIFFDFDKAEIRPDAQKSLDGNVQWLRDNPKRNFVIEGHCDERGTPEYNLALGQRRAKAAQDYLEASGIDGKRIKTISYGKERPFVVGHDESAWQLNRRAHFVLP